jgi:tellurite resistance protein TehA-like permease
VSILLHNLPYNGDWLYWISVVIFCLNVTLFITFTFISVVRHIVFPEIWCVMIRHPQQSLFLGTFPMGLATIINMVVFVCVPAWGDGAVKLVSLHNRILWTSSLTFSRPGDYGGSTL